MKELEIYIDGASRGNPGPSGIGVVIYHNKEALKKISVYIGETTNNIAEYTALIHALNEASKLKAQVLRINTDSQLLYCQLCKIYKVKSENIAQLYKEAGALMLGFKKVFIANIPREKNTCADKLASQAIKEKKVTSSLIRKQAESGCSVLVGGEESPGSGG